MVHKPESVDHGASFELANIERELRTEAQYVSHGHTTRTLVRTSDLRVILSVLASGYHIPEHSIAGTGSFLVLTGKLRLVLSSRTVEVSAGELFVLQAGMRHELWGITDSSFVLTLSWSSPAHQ
jgi:quercetin dioxygenase-like cupin family protein